jgi:hypothetical protein
VNDEWRRLTCENEVCVATGVVLLRGIAEVYSMLGKCLEKSIFVLRQRMQRAEAIGSTASAQRNLESIKIWGGQPQQEQP